MLGVPADFENKTSDIVADCPPLAAKIKSKEKGYYIPKGPRAFFPDAKRLEVYQRIIGEYNSCPQKEYIAFNAVLAI